MFRSNDCFVNFFTFFIQEAGILVTKGLRIYKVILTEAFLNISMFILLYLPELVVMKGWF